MEGIRQIGAILHAKAVSATVVKPVGSATGNLDRSDAKTQGFRSIATRPHVHARSRLGIPAVAPQSELEARLERQPALESIAGAIRPRPGRPRSSSYSSYLSR